MRHFGTLNIDDEEIPVLVSHFKFGVLLKIRKEHKQYSGTLLTDESAHLKEFPEKLAELKAGKVIKC